MAKEIFTCSICGETKKTGFLEQKYLSADDKPVCGDCEIACIELIPDSVAANYIKRSTLFKEMFFDKNDSDKLIFTSDEIRAMVSDKNAGSIFIKSRFSLIYKHDKGSVKMDRFCHDCGYSFESDDHTVKNCPICGRARSEEDVTERYGVAKEHREEIAIGESDYKDWCAIDYDNERIITINNGILAKKRNVYKFSELHSYEYFENSESYAKGGSGLGRAIVGGLLFGGVGAVVGAATRNRDVDTTIEAMKIMLTFKKESTGQFVTFTADYCCTRGWTSLRRGNKAYMKLYADIVNAMAALDEIYALGHPKEIKEPQKRKSSKSSTSSVKDIKQELFSLKELLDSGIITQQDYDEKKKQLLGI